MLNLNVNSDAGTDPTEADVRLRFQCRGCGNCCRGDGHVFLDETDLRRLAAFFGLGREAFEKRYTRTTASGDVVLKDHDDPDQSCILLEGDRCIAHEAKPEQCRDFPYTWRALAIENFCEGWRAMLGHPPLPAKGRQQHNR